MRLLIEVGLILWLVGAFDRKPDADETTIAIIALLLLFLF
jgi:hypothetical protein